MFYRLGKVYLIGQTIWDKSSIFEIEKSFISQNKKTF